MRFSLAESLMDLPVAFGRSRASTPDYVVIGDGGPISPNGDYFNTGDQYSSAIRSDKLFVIWQYSVDPVIWFISSMADFLTQAAAPAWYLHDMPTGTYAGNGYTGTPIVTAE